MVMVDLWPTLGRESRNKMPWIALISSGLQQGRAQSTLNSLHSQPNHLQTLWDCQQTDAPVVFYQLTQNRKEMLNLEMTFDIGHAAQPWTRVECAASPASHQASPAGISHASLRTDPVAHIFSSLLWVFGVFFFLPVEGFQWKKNALPSHPLWDFPWKSNQLFSISSWGSIGCRGKLRSHGWHFQ